MSKKKNNKNEKKSRTDALALAAMNAKETLANVNKGSKRKARDLLILIGAILVAMFIFFLFVELGYFIAIFTAYILLWSGALLTYWIYNRGLLSLDTKPEELSPYWTDEKKEQFLRSLKERRQKSRWLLFIIIAISFVFLLYLVLDFLLPSLYEKFFVKEG